MTCCCGGMGLFVTKLRGPGLVVLQSMPLPKLKKALGIRKGGKGKDNNNNGGNNGGGGDGM